MNWLELYYTMARIRAFELAAEQASQGGVQVLGAQLNDRAKVRGPLHLSIGQEAVAAGVCAHLNRHDLITSTHRGHGHTLAKGADMRRMMAELFGRSDGFNGGKGGSMHIADFSVGMLGANGVVAAGLPIACGAAHALKLQGLPHVVACFFGDGATNRGPFLEALNWAGVYQLPVLFICEDNRYSATTDSRAMTAGPGALARAEALGVPGVAVDGNDVAAVYQASARLLTDVRAGQARFLHAHTWRVRGHVSVDVQAYRDAQDLQGAVDADPLTQARRQAMAWGVSAAELDALDARAQADAAAAVDFANHSPWPEPAAAFSDIQTFGAGIWR